MFFGGFIQEDVFQLVGVPLVKNALAGYNASILSYGQVILDLCFNFDIQVWIYMIVYLPMKKFLLDFSLDWKWKDLHDVGSA